MWKKWHGDATKILQSPKLEHDALPTVGLHPEIRTLSFVVSRTRLAALPWGPRLAIERGRHALRLRGSELDSRQRWRSGKGLQLKKRLPDTQHRLGLVEFPVEVLPRRSVQPLCGAPPYTPGTNGKRGGRFLCWYRFT